jgi:hypothetical protein
LAGIGRANRIGADKKYFAKEMRKPRDETPTGRRLGETNGKLMKGTNMQALKGTSQTDRQREKERKKKIHRGKWCAGQTSLKLRIT